MNAVMIYRHTFSVEFTVESRHPDPARVTEAELGAALMHRVSELLLNRQFRDETRWVETSRRADYEIARGVVIRDAMTHPGQVSPALAHLLREGSAEDVTEIARFVPQVVADAQKRLLKIGMPDQIVHFARLVDGYDVKRLQEALIAHGAHNRNLFEFARDAEGADVEALYVQAAARDSELNGSLSEWERQEFQELRAAYRSEANSIEQALQSGRPENHSRGPKS